MLELQAGVFVGNVSAMVRDMLWKMVCEKLRGGAGVIVHGTANEQGFEIRSLGSASRVIEDFEGLALVRFKPPDHP